MIRADDTILAYDRQAAALAEAYERVEPGAFWAKFIDVLPAGVGRFALDVGAGTGRDAAWLKSNGFEVVAAEPSAGMRREGQDRHPHLRWIEDRLPGLTAVHRLGLSFDLVLLSAVWMHVRPGDRARAFRKIVTLLNPGGAVIMTLRHGPSPPGRPMHEVSVGEIEYLARSHGVAIVREVSSHDGLGRDDVGWTTLVLRLPDDGSASLPLVRGIILNDDKSSTYKLCLLRAVARIADGTPGAARPSTADEDRRLVPLGLVALNWIRSYLPLLKAGIPQAPGNRGPDGLGFAKDGFRALATLGVAGQELRIGASFTGERGHAVRRALSEARRTIVDMPVRYTTMPNSQATVFSSEGGASAPRGDVTITPEFLRFWGDLSVPGPLWRTLQRLGAWIEPVLTSEWARISRGYASRMGLEFAPGTVEQELVWLEPARDTGIARFVAGRIHDRGEQLRCVWSGAPLRPESLDIDHALPWSAWPCGDLWNLAPTSRRINQHEKRDRLPSATVLAAARERFIEWWRMGWLAEPALATRFELESRASLPIDDEFSAEAAFNGLEWRRLRVLQDQRPPEWRGLNG